MPYITDDTVIDNNLKVNGKVKVNSFNDIQDKNEAQIQDNFVTTDTLQNIKGVKMFSEISVENLTSINGTLEIGAITYFYDQNNFEGYTIFGGETVFNRMPYSLSNPIRDVDLVNKKYVDNNIPNLNNIDEITVNTHIQGNGSLEVKGTSTFSGTTELVGAVTADSSLSVKGTSTFTDTATFSKSPKVPTPTESEDAVNIKYIRENVLSKISLYNHTITFTTTGLGTSSTICLNFLSSKGTKYSSISAFASDHTAKQYTCSGGSTLGATVSSWYFAYKILFKSTSAVIYYQQGNGSPSEVTISYDTVSDFTDVSNAI